MKIKSILITAVLATAIFGFSAGVNAQTTDTQALIAQIQAQIAQLLQQVAQLRAQQNQPQAWCHNFNIDLDIGSAGSEASALQTALQKQGFVIASSELTSQTFGDATGQAVKGFKVKYSSQIVTAGTTKVSRITNRLLNQLYGCGIIPTPTPNPTCSNLYWFDNTSSNQCQTQKQFCGAYMYYGLRTFKSQQDCLSAFNYVENYIVERGNCIPNWTCGWGQCVNGYQSQVAIDSNNCGVTTGNNIACTALARQCDTVQPPITVTSPNGGETLTQGQTYEIKWNVSPSYYNENIDIKLYDYSTSLTNPTMVQVANFYNNPTSTIYRWTVPSNLSGSSYKLKISGMPSGGAGESVSDSSDNYFSIAAATTVCAPNWQCGEWTTCANSQQTRTCNDFNNCGTTTNRPSENQSCSTTPSITVISPNGGEIWTAGSTRNITWQSYNLSGQQVGIQLIDPITNETKYDIASFASASSGFYLWTIPTAVVPGNYKVNVFFATGVSDSSDNFFSIVVPSTQPSIMVISPNGGEKWEIGDTPKITVRWQTANISSSQKLDVIRIRAYPSNKEYDLAYNILNDGYEVVSIPYFVPAGAYTLEIKTRVNDVLISDESDSYFKTYFKTFYAYRSFVTVTSPKAGEIYTAGQTMNITWNSQSIDPWSDKLYITYSSMKQYRKPIATVSIFSNSYSWTIPNDLPNGDENFSVSITCFDCAGAPNNMILGSSPRFQIIAPQ